MICVTTRLVVQSLRVTGVNVHHTRHDFPVRVLCFQRSPLQGPLKPVSFGPAQLRVSTAPLLLAWRDTLPTRTSLLLEAVRDCPASGDGVRVRVGRMGVVVGEKESSRGAVLGPRTILHSAPHPTRVPPRWHMLP